MLVTGTVLFASMNKTYRDAVGHGGGGGIT